MKLKIIIFIALIPCFLACVGKGRPNIVSEPKDHTTELNDSIYKLLQVYEGKPILDYSITKEYVNKEYIYWSDPGYIEGPTITIKKDAILIRYKTETFEDDGALRYTDTYSISFIMGDSIVIKGNSYHGKHYHGGSCVILKDNNDNRFHELNTPLVREKPSYIYSIAELLQ